MSEKKPNLRKKVIDAMMNRLKTSRKADLYKESFTSFNVENEKNLFKKSWIRQRIVNKVVDEGINGISFYTDNEIVDKINAKLESLKFYSTLRRGLKDARKLGGGVILLGITGGQDTREPVEKVKSIDYATYIPKEFVTVEEYYEEVITPKYLMPKIYRIGDERFHDTRVIRLFGIEVDKPKDYEGFGQSVLEPVAETLKSFGLTTSGIEDIILEMTFKIFKGDILELMKTDDEELSEILKGRMEDFNEMITTDGMAVLDNKESIEKPVLNATGIDPIIKFMMVYVSAAAEMPLTKLFGQQLGTLAGATETTKDWYDTVNAWRNQFNDELAKLINAVVIEITKGIPEGFDWKWNPLHQPTAQQQGEALGKHAEIVTKLYEYGLLTFDEARESLNPENEELRLQIDYTETENE